MTARAAAVASSKSAVLPERCYGRHANRSSRDYVVRVSNDCASWPSARALGSEVDWRTARRPQPHLPRGCPMEGERLISERRDVALIWSTATNHHQRERRDAPPRAAQR